MHIEAELLAELQQNQNKQEEEPAQPEPEVKKKKRVVKKTNKENAEPSVEAAAAEKVTKKVSSKTKEDKTAIESNQEEKREVKQTKTKKKVKQPEPIAETVEERIFPTPIEQPKEEEKKVKKTKVKKIKKTTKPKEVIETNIAETNDIIYDTNTNQSDEFHLKLDEEDEIENKQEEECANNLSIMTNDEEPATTAKPSSQEFNVTVDILNRTFDKDTESDRPQNRLVSAIIAPFYIEDSHNPAMTTQATNEQSVSCNSFYKHNQQPVEEAIPKQRARIVRPKQVTTVTEVVEENKECLINKKVVVDISEFELKFN